MNKESGRILLWFLVALIIIGAFLAMIFLTSSGGSGPGTSGTLSTPVTDEEWWRGNHDSDIIFVEYSDFQCPACKSREPMIKDLLSEFGSHIRFVYRHFPLRNIHDNAQLSAQASEAAGLQGKFWEMHDIIFENQLTWSTQSNSAAEASFTSYALTLGLDIDRFKDDLDSNIVENAIDKDYESGISSGVNSTPTFFLNGTKLNPNTFDDFRASVREAVEAAS